VAIEKMDLRLIPYTDDEELKKQVTAYHLDVVLFYGAFKEASFGIVHEQGLPALVLHHRTEYADQVSFLVNTAEAGSRAVEYLAALGHEDIGLVMGPRQSVHVSGFHSGFIKALDEFHLRLRPEWLVELSPAMANKDGAAAALLPILGQAVRPSAIVFTSDWLALGGYKTARDLSLNVPQDLSIIGFDNVPVTSELTPPLTTFDLNTPKLAKMLAEIAKDLGRRWDHAIPSHRNIFLTPDLIKRESCACLRSGKGDRSAD
jgi:LacI family transcriptional regulator